MSPVLVTGARGFAGRYLVELLSNGSDAVAGWGREDVDLLDPDAVERGIAELRPSVIYHCAGVSHAGNSLTNASETLAANVLGTHHLLDALRRARLECRVLIPSSSLVYQYSDSALNEDAPLRPATPYAVSKLAQELLGRRSTQEDGQLIFIARSFNHTGPRQHPSFAAPGFARQIALIEQGRMPPEISVGNLDASRDLHDVRDTVRAYRAIIDNGRPGEAYNVCSGTAFKIRDILDRLLALSRVTAAVRVDSSRYRANDNPVLVGNPAKIRRAVGWTPSIPLERTLADLLDYWRREVRQ